MSGDRHKLDVKERTALGSAHTRRLRAQGYVPGVLYGKGEPRAIAVPERALRTALTGPSGMHAVLDVVVEGQKTAHPSILKELQQDPLRGKVSHIDLHEVRLDQPIQSAVQVVLVGEAAGAKVGGALSQIANEVTVEALPMEMPERLEADVSALEIGDTLRLADLVAPEGATFVDDLEETVIATVTQPTRVEEPEEAEEAAEGEELPEGAAEEPGAEAAEAEAAGEPDTDEG